MGGCDEGDEGGGAQQRRCAPQPGVLDRLCHPGRRWVFLWPKQEQGLERGTCRWVGSAEATEPHLLESLAPLQPPLPALQGTPELGEFGNSHFLKFIPGIIRL